MRARFCAAALLAAASFPLQAHDDSLEIVTLSNRADLVSGGDALLEVRLPKGTSLSRVKLKLNGHNVTSSFQAVSGGRALRGLVSGLVQGRNDFVAEIDERHGHDRREHLVITNHPIGGPVLSGPQITPYFCATPTPQPATPTSPATNASGLSTFATGPECNITAETKLWYRSTQPAGNGAGFCSLTLPDANNPPANPCFKPYTPGTTPADLATSPRGGALHRARRARHHEPRHLRHRRAVRPDQALGRRHRSAGAVERQDPLPVRRLDRPAAAPGALAVKLDQRNGAVARLPGGAEQHDRLRAQFESRVDVRDGHDDEGAHRRQVRPGQVHHGHRLLGRIDQLEHERLDHAGQPRRHHDLLRVSRLGDHRHRGRRLHAARRGLRQEAVDGPAGRAYAGPDQRQESGDQRAPGSDRLPGLVQRFRQQRQGRQLRAALRAREHERRDRDFPAAGPPLADDQQLPAAAGTGVRPGHQPERRALPRLGLGGVDLRPHRQRSVAR